MSDGPTLLVRARQARLEGDLEGALARLLALQEQGADAAGCALELCAVLRRLGDPKRARAQAEAGLEALQRAGRDPGPARLQLGLVSLLSGRRSSARAHLRASLEGVLSPEERALALLGSAAALADRSEGFEVRWDEAIAATRHAVDAEIAMQAEQVADRARVTGHVERARAAYALAAELWGRLGDDERVTAMDRAASRLC